jgi:thiamine-phosphate pyrophosphorylase
MNKIKGYYFITDKGLSRRGNASDVADAVECGVSAVQYRDKGLGMKEMYKEALALKSICGDKTLFLINDRVEVAAACDADGVHIGQEDMGYSEARKMLGKNKIIGVTAHNIEEAINAQEAGADYVGVSPIFSTATKTDAGKPAGIKLIEAVKMAVKIPVIAIGGINLSNAAEVVKAGADGLCAISAVVASGNVKAEILKFQKLFK